MSASSKKKLRKEQEAAALTEKQLQEKKEAKKLKIYTITFVCVMALVVGIALFVMGGQAISNTGIIQKSTTAMTVGEHKLSSVDLNYYYIDAINSTYSEWTEYYGSSASMYVQLLYGLDMTSPLNTQYYDQEGKVTWAQYFVDMAYDNAKSTYAMYDLAKAAGHEMTEEETASIDTAITNSLLYATLYYGYTDLNDYLAGLYGPGANEDNYREYLEVSALAQSYYTAYSETLNYDDAAIAAYDAEHHNEFTGYSFTSFYIPASDFLEGTTDEEGNVTYTDEQRAAAVKAAEAAADKLVASGAADEDALNMAIATIDVYKDDDTAVASANKDVFSTSISSVFSEWICDDARVEGEITKLVNESTSTDADGNETTTVNGYYVVIYNGKNENNMQLVNVRHILAQFEGGTTDSTTGVTTYSDEEKAAAKAKIEEVLAAFEATDKTEDSFAALVHDNTDDTGSQETGGLYEDVYPGQMVTAFNDWCFAEGRKHGDVEIVETEYGYHLMFYVGQAEQTYRELMIESTLLTADMEEWYTAAVEAVESELITDKHLNLDLIMNGTV